MYGACARRGGGGAREVPGRPSRRAAHVEVERLKKRVSWPVHREVNTPSRREDGGGAVALVQSQSTTRAPNQASLRSAGRRRPRVQHAESPRRGREGVVRAAARSRRSPRESAAPRLVPPSRGTRAARAPSTSSPNDATRAASRPGAQARHVSLVWTEHASTARPRLHIRAARVPSRRRSRTSSNLRMGKTCPSPMSA